MDRSNGYEAVFPEFIALRTAARVGAETVRAWAQTLPKGAAVLDLGCGQGVPVSEVLVDCGLAVHAVDASPSMAAAYRSRFPDALVECAPVEDSDFFGRAFHGIVAWGLMFLLTPEEQSALIHGIARALEPGGTFLFTAPWQVCEWADNLTGRRSVSLGSEAYRRIAEAAGLGLVDRFEDEAGNHYYLLERPRAGGDPVNAP